MPPLRLQVVSARASTPRDVRRLLVAILEPSSGASEAKGGEVSGLSGSFFWTMQDEVAFIRGLGSHRPPNVYAATVAIPREDIIRGYLAGLELRTVWGSLQCGELRRIAEQELQDTLGVEEVLS